MSNLVLHYAPDNASLCIRLALEAASLPFETRLVDRASSAHKSESYRALNPNGLIPVLETPDGTLFETAAILLWLAEQKPYLLPSQSAERAQAVKWLIWMSNTLHPTLRMLFYADQFTTKEGQNALSEHTRTRLCEQLAILDIGLTGADYIGGKTPSILDCYLCPLLRWMQLYPIDAPSRPNLSDYPTLQRVAALNETYASTASAIIAEGLGKTPFTAPNYAQPPEGSAV
ncbi:glutathione S-transferase family protein [Octadecabacter ascidiaceicola]|uniref:Glutathione S-transferase GST-4.5 n=1 Tax=Octadecabacter ascidiaceicola TaxID=1655543 RepID=A0A238K4A3_9RHOB|nr:glutathione S-transferase family protein [Octadecabacter ascidiaceicola]SMX37740.1 Glutathione S-transferase GST-4.5 [Octadecabacter ascidiaceicola]